MVRFLQHLRVMEVVEVGRPLMVKVVLVVVTPLMAKVVLVEEVIP